MADAEGRSGGTSALAFIVGGLLVAVLAIGFFVYYNQGRTEKLAETPSVDLNIQAPDMPDITPPPAPEIPTPELPAPTPAPEPAPQ